MAENFDSVIKQFEENLKELNLVPDGKQMEQFVEYYHLLVEWNSFMNLTAITDMEGVFQKHFVDSLSIVKAYDFTDCILEKGLSLIDVGTGAGFPSIPIKIMFPGVKMTLLDSLKKRVNFLDEVIGKLGLEDAETIHGRAEDFGREEKFRESYHLCVSRAVANLSTLSEYCIPFVKTGGKFISYKSEKLAEELSAAEKAVFLLGGKVTGQVDFYLPHSDIYRNLLVIDKIKPTPGKFPRKAGIPAKEPL